MGSLEMEYHLTSQNEGTGRTCEFTILVSAPVLGMVDGRMVSN